MIFKDFEGLIGRLFELMSDMDVVQRRKVGCNLAEISSVINEKTRHEIIAALVQEEGALTDYDLLYFFIAWTSEYIDLLSDIFPQITALAIQSNDFTHIQEVFLLSSEIIKEINNPEQIKSVSNNQPHAKRLQSLKLEVENLLKVTLQGHLAFLENNPLNDYDSPKFNFYKLAKNYVRKYPQNPLSAQIVEEILDWIPQFPLSMIEPAVSVIIQGIIHPTIFTERLIEKGYNYFIQSLQDSELDEDVISSLGTALLLMHENYPQEEQTHKILDIYTDIFSFAEENNIDEIMFEIPIIMIDIFSSNETPLPIDPKMFHIFQTKFCQQNDSFKYIDTLKSIITLFQKFGSYYEFFQDFAMIFAYFYFMNETERKRIKIDNEIIDNLKELLKVLIQEHRELKVLIKRKFGKRISTLQRIDELFDEIID